MVSHVHDCCPRRCSASLGYCVDGQLCFFFPSFPPTLSHNLTTRFQSRWPALEFGLWQPLLKLSEKEELQHVVKAQVSLLDHNPVATQLRNKANRFSTGRDSVQQFSQGPWNKRQLRSHILPQSQTDESMVSYRP